VYIYIHYVHTCQWRYIYICVCICIYIYMYIYVCVYIYVCACMIISRDELRVACDSESEKVASLSLKRETKNGLKQSRKNALDSPFQCRTFPDFVGTKPSAPSLPFFKAREETPSGLNSPLDLLHVPCIIRMYVRACACHVRTCVCVATHPRTKVRVTLFYISEQLRREGKG